MNLFPKYPDFLQSVRVVHVGDKSETAMLCGDGDLNFDATSMMDNLE